ncbi:hypothetical protein [Deminuibacter soli]|uniref:Uncharacterized protein n=1 Tax=Deminuibacter soli TaxID=2291815 RepID=A0A3E1NFQ7_9BACT|nr:hypothetical protein [Deminuibacter soli]RFM26707.1 hypothetical protein DXN05_19255 [Deminuibacter soli]
MLRQIVQTTDKFYTLRLPDDLVGKTVEVLAFEVDQAPVAAISLSKDERIKAIQNGMSNYRLSLKDFTFNRDEANDYE